MNKPIRFIPALALAMAMMLIPTLATAKVTIAVNTNAPIFDAGVGAVVTVKVTCDASCKNSSLLPTISLTQRSGDMVAWGAVIAQQDPIDCDGIPHTFKYPITSQLKIFSRGTAFFKYSASIVPSDFSKPSEHQQIAKNIPLVQ